MQSQKTTWTKLRQNTAAYLSLWLIGAMLVMAVLGYWIMPDSSPAANTIVLQISTHKPGSKICFLKIRKQEIVPTVSIFEKWVSGQKDAYQYIPITKFTIKGANIEVEEYIGEGVINNTLLTYNLAEVLYPLSSDHKPVIAANDVTYTTIDGQVHTISVAVLAQDIASNNIVHKRYYLGTDRYGRDMLSRLILGARISLSVGLLAVFISIAIGILLGAMAGYFGGWVDAAIGWLINVVWALPTLLLVIAISFALGKGFWQIFIAVGLSMWVEVARLVRGQVLSIREKEYIEATRAMGFSTTRIIIKHILPNITGPLLVVASANFASAILLEAGLSFLGFGAQPPFPSWGGMIKEHYGYIVIDAAYMAILPGLMIMLVVYAFNMLSVGLRDALDVKAEQTAI